MKRFLLFIACVIAASISSFSWPSELQGLSEDEDSDTLQTRLQPKEYISDYPGELIRVQDLKLGLQFRDIFIPGDAGFDLTLVRRYYSYTPGLVGFGRGWALDLPVLSALVNPATSKENFACLGNLSLLSLRMNGADVHTVGLPEHFEVPNNAVVAFANNALLVCANSGVELWFGDGKRIHFAQLIEQRAGQVTQKFFYPTSIKDRFGNQLSLRYTRSSWPSHVKLLSIRRNDGVEVRFTYGQHRSAGYSEEYITGIEFGAKRVRYLYELVNGPLLTEACDPAGECTTFKYAGHQPTILEVNLPNGIKASYQYHALNADSVNNGNVHSRVLEVKGVGRLHSFFAFPGVYQGERAIKVDYDVNGGRDITTEYQIDRTPVASTTIQSGQAALAGTVKEISIYSGYWGKGPNTQYLQHRLVYKKVLNYQAVKSGSLLCRRRVAYMVPSVPLCHRRILSKVKQIVQQEDGTDVYWTEFREHDGLGRPRQTVTWNSFSPRRKYTKTIFVHDGKNWLTKFEAERLISADGQQWVSINKREYFPWNASNGFRYQLRRLIGMGGVVKRTFTNYDQNGNVLEWSDENGSKYNYSNYKFGTFRERLLPLSQQPQKIYVDDYGRVSKIVDEKGDVVERYYDNNDRLIREIYTDSSGNDNWSPSTYKYGNATSEDVASFGVELGQEKVEYQRGTERKITFYTGFGQPSKIVRIDLTDPKNTTLFKQFRYDSLGRLTFESDWGIEPQTSRGKYFDYDDLSRVIKVRTSLGDTLTKYLTGNRVQITDARGNNTVITYESYGAPKQRNVIGIEEPGAIKTTIRRDIFGRPVEIVRSGGWTGITSYRRTFHYDNRGYLCHVYMPEVGNIQYHYRNSGELAWKAVGVAETSCRLGSRPPADATRYYYDARGRLYKVDYPGDTTDETYAYDMLDRLTWATRGNVRRGFTYNSLGLLNTESLYIDGRVMTLQYGYDQAGHLDYVIYPSGRRIDLKPDAFGRPTVVGKYISEVTYDSTGMVKAYRMANGKQLSVLFNTANLPERIIVPSLVDINYSFDANGNPIAIIDRVNNRENRFMSYDALNRLIRAQGPWGEATYQYDAMDNIVFKRIGTKHYQYHYSTSNNLLKSITGSEPFAFEYDKYGNVVSNGRYQFKFDAANRLTELKGEKLSKYEYDALGYRVRVNFDGNRRYAFYNRAGQLMHRYDVSRGLGTDFLYLNNKKVVRIDGAPSAQAPRMPQGLNVLRNVMTNNILVTWEAVEGASRYILQARDRAGRWRTVYSGVSLTRNVSDETQSIIQFRVAACNHVGCGFYRDSEVLVVNLPTLKAPAAPSSLSVPSQDNDGSFVVRWASSAAATSYELQRKQGAGGWQTVSSGAATNYYEKGLATGLYFYRVRACNSAGCSAWSDTKQIFVNTDLMQKRIIR